MNEARRRRLAETMTHPSALEEVADAIAAFGDRPHVKVYVERRAEGYRWSPAHAGGPYPLLREVAQFLDLDHHQVAVPCGAVDGWSVISPEGPQMSQADAWAFIVPSTDKRSVAQTIVARLTAPGSTQSA